MNFLRTLIFGLVFSFSTSAAAAERPTKIVDVGGNPESLVSYGNRVFVSNLGKTSDPTEDGDGYISEISIDGKLIKKHLFPQRPSQRLNFPMGLTVISDVIYVVDLKRIVGLDIRTEKLTIQSEAPFPELEYLNDIAFVGEFTFLLSGTSSKKVFTFHTKTEAWGELKVGTDLGFVNGILYNRSNDTLLVVHNNTQTLSEKNGTLSAFSLKKNTADLLWELKFGSFLDGITHIGNGSIAISDWDNPKTGSVIHYVDTNHGHYLNAEKVRARGVADLHFDRHTNTMLFPALVEGAVHVHSSKFEPTKSIKCVSRPGDDLGEMKIQLDRFLVPRVMRFGEGQCTIGYAGGESAEHTYYDTTPGNCDQYASKRVLRTRLTHVKKRDFISVEVTVERDPDTNCPHPRLCDPSTEYTAYYSCRL